MTASSSHVGGGSPLSVLELFLAEEAPLSAQEAGSCAGELRPSGASFSLQGLRGEGDGPRAREEIEGLEGFLFWKRILVTQPRNN